mgnify:CR=1 FL=1
MTKDLTQSYFEKLSKSFKKWRLLDKKAEAITFHLAELANFSGKYKALCDELLKQTTNKKFLEKLEEFHGILMEKHEVEYHLIPADKLLTSWFKKREDI